MSKQHYLKLKIALVLLMFIVSIVALANIALAKRTQKPSISFYDGGWPGVQIDNAIAKYIIEKGYDYSVKIIETRMPGMQRGFVEGTMDVNMEMWQALDLEWVNNNVKKGVIVNLGPIFHSGEEGIYVPRYVIKGDPKRGIDPMAPDLESVTDLIRYKHIFAKKDDPEKGRWINCIDGWGCQPVNQVKMTTYGLDAHFKAVIPKTGEDMDEMIASAYKKGEPFVTYYYSPSPLVGLCELVKLKEPEYTDECWVDIQEAVANYKPGIKARSACAYETVSVHKFCSRNLFSKAPDVVAFLANMHLGIDRAIELAGYMKKGDASADEVALFFLTTYKNQWKNWVPENIYRRIKKTLH